MVKLLLFAILIGAPVLADEPMCDWIFTGLYEWIQCEIYMIQSEYTVVFYDGSIRKIPSDIIKDRMKRAVPDHLRNGFIKAKVSGSCKDIPGKPGDIMRDVILIENGSKICGVIKPTEYPGKVAMHKYDGSVQIIRKENIKKRWTEPSPDILKLGYEYIKSEAKETGKTGNAMLCDEIRDKWGNVHRGVLINNAVKGYYALVTYDCRFYIVPRTSIIKYRCPPVPKYLEDGYRYVRKEVVRIAKELH